MTWNEGIWEDLLKLLFSLGIGAIIGAEREFKSKSAGFRTISLVCLGSTFFSILAYKIGGPSDAARMLANVIMGVGFLGSGVIFRNSSDVKGLTTASTVWISAALGMAVGMGHFVLATIVMVLVLGVLWGFTVFQNMIDKANIRHTYMTLHQYKESYIQHMEELAFQCGVEILSVSHHREDTKIKSQWELSGRYEAHQQWRKELLNNPSFLEAKF